jgi:alpha,alpha-trehalase
MKLVSLFHLVVAAISISLAAGGSAALAQQTTESTSTPAPNPDATLNYIHGAWQTLTRSQTDCHSLVDSKITTTPILYLPAGMPKSAELSAIETSCNVKVQSLPRAIEKLGDLKPEELSAPGLLYLPKPYVVPGGRFNEMYGWDSYFIVLGLVADHQNELAKNMVDNQLFEVENYGAVLNANRSYYLTRSQPPFLTSMIRAVYESPASFSDRTAAHAWLEHAYTLAVKDYSTWIRPEHMAGTTSLARYFDYGMGPVPEMADDSTYYPDVIRWLEAHPGADAKSFLVKGSEHPDDREAAALRTTSCDVKKSVVCEHAWAAGYRLSKDFYAGDRAMRESGFDPSFRFQAFSGATHHYAPVCLNSLLYRYESDLAHMALLLGKPHEATRWRHRAKVRAAAMQRYLWREREGVFADYDFVHHKSSDYAYITSLYPLWAGVATREQADRIVEKLNLFERDGGLSMSHTQSGLQWDDPFGWAPTNWIATAGLASSGHREEALRIAKNFCATVDSGFAKDGTIREKYNVVSGNSNVQVSAGYKTNVIGFGWTNAAYLKMKELIAEK